jgi:hypothetical protein
MTAPALIKLEASEVKCNSTSKRLDIGPLTINLFTQKNEAGIEKGEATAIKFGLTGYKKEYQVIKSEKSATKTELVSMRSSTTMLVQETITVHTKNAVMKIQRGACLMESHGFTKIGS